MTFVVSWLVLLRKCIDVACHASMLKIRMAKLMLKMHAAWTRGPIDQGSKVHTSCVKRVSLRKIRLLLRHVQRDKVFACLAVP